MKSMSIKLKVILVIVVCLALGAGALIYLVQQSYDKNVQLVSQDALDTARKSFKNLEESDLRALRMASASLETNEKMKELFAKRDRAAFQKYMDPLFQYSKKEFGISIMLFVEPEPSKKVFIRMNTPDKFDDVYKQQAFSDAIKTKKPSTGSELGKLGYALRCVTPLWGSKKELLGYMTLGDTYDNFLDQMKKQSGDDYMMVGSKKLLDEERYRTGQQRKKLKDYWDEFKDVVVLSATVEDHGKKDLTKDIADIPDEGKILGTEAKGDKTFIRAVFPLIDGTGTRIGGIFVTHDITELQKGMASTKMYAIAAIIVLILVISLAIIVLLSRLVFARLQHTMEVATRVVGGEFETEIVPTSNDEVGKLEALLEQFRGVFVNVVKDLEESQKK